MADPNLQNKLQRVEDLWFPDADLILRAENSLFRVYSSCSILGARSSVSRDMVAFLQPTDAEGDIIDGVPVIRLHDSALETEVFLRAIFGVDSFSKFFMPPPSPVKFSAVIGVMRLAHRYDVQYLFRRALCHLESMYPMEFSCFQAMSQDEEAEPHIIFPAGIVTDLIALHAASAVGVQWLLPSIYYSISIYLTAEMLGSGEPWHTLGPHEQQTCLISHPNLIRAATIIHEFLQKNPNGRGPCSSPRDCAEAREFLLIRTKQGRRDTDPLQEWVFAETENGLCVVCSVAGQAEYSSAQLFFWLDMPEIFKLPSWEDLDELRRQVMECCMILNRFLPTSVRPLSCSSEPL
ncbi:hypothetical protein DFH07DRAFT_731393 [Mycena maculata]|uniref:BTB domain-containing protein n=1 Tax=Mycena maculata TaxID=230809 RepID=A0AAD7K6Z0_9AGAR|nr:hypothetical protein DFH07DRAFT_731393 [Mycena maculata]